MAILHGLTYAEYAALPGWNWSLIKLLENQSPRHVQHARTAPDHDTAARVFLRAVHALVLEPHTFGASFSVFDGTRRGKLYDAHVVCHPGTTVLNPREYGIARATADAIRNHPVVAQLLADGHGEVTVTWTDGPTGLPCKGRLDWLTPAVLLDLKTLGTVHERAVARLVAGSLYHGQLAHYDDGLRENDVEVERVLIVAAEGKGAQDVAVYEADRGVPDGTLHVGKELRKRLMAKLADCVAADSWPGRHETVQDLCLPQYALLDDVEAITFGEQTAEEAL